MAGYNRIIMMGNLTRDPEIKQLQSGISVGRLSIASNRSYKNRQGELMQDVCFVDVDVWGPQAESCNKYLQKGRPVLIEGRLKLDTWKDNEGNTRSKHSIVADIVQFLNNGTQDEQNTSQQQQASTQKSGAGQQAAPKAEQQQKSSGHVKNQQLDEPPFEDDLPF